LSTIGKALITAEDKDGRQKNTEEQIFFGQEQSDKNSDTNPEHDETDGFLHSWPPSLYFPHYFISILYSMRPEGNMLQFIMKKCSNRKKIKIYFIFA